MFEAAQMMETWVESILMERHAPQRVDARGVMRTLFGGATIAHPSAIDAIAQSGFHHVTGTTVYMLDGFGSGALTHEMFHVLDNKFGFSAFFGSAAWGGGPADDMARAVGQNIGLCIYRSRCFGFYGNTPGAEEPPQTEREHYAWSGPSEDFAQTARYLVMDSTNVGAGRTEWFGNFVALQVATSAFGGTPYNHWQRTSEPKFRHLGWGYFQ